MNGCFCASDEEPEDDPPPIPDVTSLAIRAFSEQVWQRGDGSLFVTEDMAGEMPIEPPN
ncbi:MAG TPA: hypothetical protein VE078_02030 [Thermoanaerobaculia bacterium]|nr:hypothetical protein [Thermoanaerobaculia bacterium]